MLRLTLAAITLAVNATLAQAHFVFVVPAADGRTAQVLMSEDLKPDPEVPIKTIEGATFAERDASGRASAVTPSAVSEHVNALAMKPGTRVVTGHADLGVVRHGPSKPNWLSYYPKAIVGNPFETASVPGLPVELVPVRDNGHLRLRLLADGKPVPSGQVTIVPAGGNQDAVETDDAGLTPAIEQTGRVGFWARNVRATAGEHGGKKYEEIRRYATLVIDVPAGAATAAAPTTAPATAPAAVALKTRPFPAMPRPASSFGAVAAGGYLYLYGGHIVDTHSYSTASVSGEFHRISLARPAAWEKLPGGAHLQGLNLAAYGGKIIRAGGMSPQNKDGEADNVRSVADVARYDPQAAKWTALPALPEPRSSHDLAVVGDTLFVIGGWTLTGEPGDAKWHDDMLALDLARPDAGWKSLPQPFKRRALIAAVYHGKIYAMGGFQEDDEPSLDTNVYDPATHTWTKGPTLPTPKINGFGPAACVAGGRLYASVGDGSLLRLNGTGDGWELLGKATPRIVHRMAPDGDRVLIIGGAARQKQSDLIEAVEVSPAAAATAGVR